MTFLSCSGPFFGSFLMPLSRSMDVGTNIFSGFLCLVVRVIFSFLPVLVGARPSTFSLAMPLNLNEWRPQRFPVSADIVLLPAPGLFRMKELLAFTHSQMSAADAILSQGAAAAATAAGEISARGC